MSTTKARHALKRAHYRLLTCANRKELPRVCYPSNRCIPLLLQDTFPPVSAAGDTATNTRDNGATTFRYFSSSSQDTTSSSEQQQQQQQQQHYTESSSKRPSSPPSNLPYRPWDDQQLPLEVRVTKFVQVELGHLRPHAILFDAVALAETCCRQNTSKFNNNNNNNNTTNNMKLAHDVLDRCLAEQRHSLDDTSSNNNNNNNNTPVATVVVPLKLFQTILFGWCSLATTTASSTTKTTKGGNNSITEERMQELVNTLLQVVRHDEEILRKQQRNQQHSMKSSNTSVSSSSSSSSVSVSVTGHRLLPNTDFFNTYLYGLKLLASQSSRTAAGRGIQLLQEMNHMHVKHGWHTKPNTKSYTLVIGAIANNSSSNNNSKNAGPQAEGVLRRLIQAHETEKQLYLEQYGEDYNIVEKSKNKRQIPTPDILVYAAVIRAYSQGYSVRGANKARELLVGFMTMLKGMEKGGAQQHQQQQADALLFTTVIAAFSTVASNRKLSAKERWQAAQNAEEVLDMMVEEFKKNSNNKDNNGAAATTTRLEAIEPYNACINAYAKSGSLEGRVRAEELLQTLLSDFTNGTSTIAPNTVTFNTALSAWVRGVGPSEDAPQKAEELLELQVELVESGVLGESARPDSQSFVTVMNAYARSKHPEKVQHTYRLLKALLGGIVDGKVSNRGKLAVPFTTVLNAAANSAPNRITKPSGGTTFVTDTGDLGDGRDTNDDVYTIALQTYRELKDDAFQLGCQPDHMAFAAMLEVLYPFTHAKSIERRQMVQMVFEDACAAGEVSKLVLKAIYKVVPDKEMLASLLQSQEWPADGIGNANALPGAWTRNVEHKFRARNIKRVK